MTAQTQKLRDRYNSSYEAGEDLADFVSWWIGTRPTAALSHKTVVEIRERLDAWKRVTSNPAPESLQFEYVRQREIGDHLADFTKWWLDQIPEPANNQDSVIVVRNYLKRWHAL